jgi:hypothetical protein
LGFLLVELLQSDQIALSTLSISLSPQLPVSGTVMVAEELSGDSSPCHPKDMAFVTTDTAPENCTHAITKGGNLTIKITTGQPTMFNHFLRQLQITVTRTPYDHSCPTNIDGAVACPAFALQELDVVFLDQWVPVTGNLVISGGVPKTFTVRDAHSCPHMHVHQVF